MFDPRTGFGAGPIAHVATLGLCDSDFLFTAVRGFFERNFHVVAQIPSALRLRGVGASAAPKQIIKNAAASASAAPEHFAENIEWIVEASGPRGTAARAAIECGVAVLVIQRPL